VRRRQFLELAGCAFVLHCVPRRATLAETANPNLPPDARRLTCHWQQLKHGKYISDLNETGSGPRSFTQLFVNGRRQIPARFPGSEPSGAPTYISAIRFLPRGAFVPDCELGVDVNSLVGIEFNPATFSQKRWSKPDEAVLCLKTAVGDLRMHIYAIDYDRNFIWCGQVGGLRPLDLQTVPRFYVENVYEELNAPREWYLNRQEGILYYRPADDIDMSTALFQVV
jgi:hypothetical protein